MSCAGWLDVVGQALDVQLLSVLATGAVKGVMSAQVYPVSTPMSRFQWDSETRSGSTYDIDKLIVRIVSIGVWLRSSTG